MPTIETCNVELAPLSSELDSAASPPPAGTDAKKLLRFTSRSMVATSCSEALPMILTPPESATQNKTSGTVCKIQLHTLQ